MIQIEGLSFRYPGAERDAIDGLSLEVKSGSLFGLLGPNGSGKTTLISLLSSLLTQSGGTLRVDGKALPAGASEVQPWSSLVPQEYAFYPRLTVLENLRFFAAALAIPAAARRERIAEALAVTGLEPSVRMRAAQLSGGLKRRLNLAIGLLNRPRLLFLDEPTVGMDPQSRRFILDAIKRINAAGSTVVYTSHYMEEVEALCDEIGVLDQGRLLARGTLAELLGDEQGRQLTVNLKAAPTPDQGRALASLPPHELGGSELGFAACSSADFQRVLEVLRGQGLSVTRVKYGYGNLEELFLHLTGRQLRD